MISFLVLPPFWSLRVVLLGLVRALRSIIWIGVFVARAIDVGLEEISTKYFAQRRVNGKTSLLRDLNSSLVVKRKPCMRIVD